MTGLEALHKEIRTFMNAFTDDMATGGAADFPAYREAVGVIKGLALAERALLDIQARLVSED